MSSTVTDAIHDWATKFLGVDTRVNAVSNDAATAPAATPAHDPAWHGRPMRKVDSALDSDDDLDRYQNGDPPAPAVSMQLDETSVTFEPEDMSAHSKDRDIRKSAAKVHKTVQDNAPMIADQDRKNAAMKAEADRQQIVEKVDFISNAVKANCALMCNAVGSACSDFQTYATNKIEEVKKKRMAAAAAMGIADLYVALVSIVADVTGAQIVAKITTELGRQVADAIKGALKDKIVDKTKDAVKGEVDLDDLQKAIGSLAHAARLNAEDTTKTAFGGISAMLTKVKDGAPDKLSDDASTFITPFLDATPAQADAYLEGYGVPNASSCTSIRTDIFKGLVQEFSKKLIVEEWKEQFRSDVIDDEMKNNRADFDKRIAGAAKVRAEQAAKQLDEPI
jgi:hypothetical protein